MKKSIMCFLLAVVMVMSMATGVMAYEAPDEGVAIYAERVEEKTAVRVCLTAEGVTNGRVVVTYDTTKVSLVSARAESEAWVSSVNTETAGEVSIAWAGSDLPAQESSVAVLLFTDLSDRSEEAAVYSVEVVECYDDGEVVSLGSDTGTVDENGNVEEPDEPGPVGPEFPSIPTDPEEPAEPENPFIDIDDSWAKEDILTAYYAGLIKGTSENTYSPELNVTRAMFVTLLYRLEGEPAVSGETPFTDLAEGEYYVDAVAWAYENGVVNGTSDSTYSPNAVITREQMVTMLYRYAKYDGRDVAVSDDLASFSDAGSVSDWALDAVKWAVADGIIQGYDGVLSPQGSATREQMAAIFVRYAGL